MIETLENVYCNGILGDGRGIPQNIGDLIHYLYLGIKIVVPILLVIFAMLDLGRAIAAKKEEDIKKYQGSCIKRIITGVLVFLVVVVVEFVLGFVCPSNIPLTAIAGIIVKTGTGLELGCATVFLADVVDYGEYVLGVRNEGVVFSLQTLIVKLTAAFTALAIGFVLELTGYVPNAVQSLATQNSIRVLMCIVPALGIILAYVVFKTKYKLNDEFMKKVVAKISGKAEE